MTAQFYKNVYQKTYLPNNFRFRILGNKSIRSVPSRNKFFVIALKNYKEADFKVSSLKYISCMEERRLYLKILKNLSPNTLNSIIKYNQT